MSKTLEDLERAEKERAEQQKRIAAEELMVYLTWTAIDSRDLKALTELLQVSRGRE